MPNWLSISILARLSCRYCLRCRPFVCGERPLSTRMDSRCRVDRVVEVRIRSGEEQSRIAWLTCSARRQRFSLFPDRQSGHGYFHSGRPFGFRAQFNRLLAFAKASSNLLASLPPPRALSGLPPPLPPTIGAICWMILPA